MLRNVRVRLARWLLPDDWDAVPSRGLRIKFMREMKREHRGCWWEWRHWSQSANAVYHRRRFEDALASGRYARGYYEPSARRLTPEDPDRGSSA